MPDSRIATMSSVVATGRRMKISETFIVSHPCRSVSRACRRLHTACERAIPENRGPPCAGMAPTRDELRSNCHPAPAFCLSSVFAQNRLPLVRTMALFPAVAGPVLLAGLLRLLLRRRLRAGGGIGGRRCARNNHGRAIAQTGGAVDHHARADREPRIDRR